MKKVIIEAGKILLYPLMIIFVGISIFNDIFRSLPYFRVYLWVLLLFAVIIILGGVLEFINKKR